MATCPLPLGALQLHGTQRKFFDSGEHFSAKQGIKLPDLLPGGAPAEACPKKTEPSVYPQVRERCCTEMCGMGPVSPSRQRQAGRWGRASVGLRLLSAGWLHRRSAATAPGVVAHAIISISWARMHLLHAALPSSSLCPQPSAHHGLHPLTQRQYRKMDAAAANLTADQIQQPMHKMSCTDY